MKFSAEYKQSSEIGALFANLKSDKMVRAGALGLNEHAEEQRRTSIIRITGSTGVPKSRVSTTMRVVKASPSAQMTAVVRTADKAITLAEYGNAVWVRDLNPMADGIRGGSVSSMKGAEATAFNVRRQFPGAFVTGGQVVIRTSSARTPLKILSGAVLANELAKPTRPNVAAAERFMALDMEKRVMRHVLRALG